MFTNKSGTLTEIQLVTCRNESGNKNGAFNLWSEITTVTCKTRFIMRRQQDHWQMIIPDYIWYQKRKEKLMN